MAVPENPKLLLASGPLFATQPSLRKTKSMANTGDQPLSSRRPALKMSVSPEQESEFRLAIQQSRKSLTSDASVLPKSTNMGFPKGTGHLSVQKPRSIPQPVAEKERARVMTDHDKVMQAHDDQVHSWEESETSTRTRSSSDENKARFIRAIPCLFTSNVANATSFYKDILGFDLLGRPDTSHASLVRLPTGRSKTGTVRVAPPDSLQLYLRIAPLGADGEREKPCATTIWIEVSDVDSVYEEFTSRWKKFAPQPHEYFPMHSFGNARLMGKPQNKAWGNRELHVIDGDENKIIFFKQLGGS